MSGDQITYNPGIVAGVSSDMINQAGQLTEIHSDVTQKTGALTEYFQGKGATGFFDAQHQMLSGLQDLIDTVQNHGHTVGNVGLSAIATDASLPNLF
jgi:WXG100 family type VII secretion target